MHTIQNYLENNRQQMLEALQALIRIPSVKSAPEAGMPFGKCVNDALCAALALADKLGLPTTNMDGYLGFAHCGNNENTLGILVHLDVVPVGDGWIHPPFGGVVENGRVYGRGAQDDKGPAVAALYALAAINAAKVPLERSVRLIFGCDEESGWEDIDYYKRHEPLPQIAFSPDGEYPVVNSERGIAHISLSRRAKSSVCIRSGDRPNVVPGEATAVFNLPLEAARVPQTFNGCKVRLTKTPNGAELTVTGKSAHASTPEKGANAAIALLGLLGLLVIGEDAQIAKTLFDLLGDASGAPLGLNASDADSGALTLSLGIVDWSHEAQRLVLDVRHPLCIEREEVLSRVKAALGAQFEVALEYASAPHFVPADSPLVKKLLNVYEKHTGKSGYTIAIGGGTYARAIPNALTFGCQFPGEEHVAHMRDEYISLESFYKSAQIMADAIMALAAKDCGI